jgi:hypothetical protein
MRAARAIRCIPLAATPGTGFVQPFAGIPK